MNLGRSTLPRRQVTAPTTTSTWSATDCGRCEPDNGNELPQMTMARCLRPALTLPLHVIAYGAAWAVAWIALGRMLRHPPR